MAEAAFRAAVHERHFPVRALVHRLDEKAGWPTGLGADVRGGLTQNSPVAAYLARGFINMTKLNLPQNFKKGNTLPQSGALKVSCRPAHRTLILAIDYLKLNATESKSAVCVF